MRTSKRMAVGITSAALVLGAGTGIAVAAGGGGAGSGGPPGGGPPGAQAITSYLGITADQLRTDLQGGETLAQIATAQGKTASGLETAMLADASTHLDATQLANLKAHIDDIVNSTGPPAGHGPGGPGGPGGPPGAQAIATYLGVTTAELQSDLQGGKTLAQVATAQGKTVSGLEAAMLADASTHLDATQLANLKAHIDDIVNSSGPPARPSMSTSTSGSVSLS
ncbi:MAG TPA: hypothetical protein VGL76_04365 [Gaiellaceae bacterium]|jgi:hypothetical protein